jgi:hypothetical protein
LPEINTQYVCKLLVLLKLSSNEPCLIRLGGRTCLQCYSQYYIHACLLLLQILSGASNGFNTGMPRSDIVLATAISTALATGTMGVVANYPVR